MQSQNSYIHVLGSLWIASGISFFKDPFHFLFSPCSKCSLEHFPNLGGTIYPRLSSHWTLKTWYMRWAPLASPECLLENQTNLSHVHSIWNQSLNFNKILSWFVCILKFEKHSDTMPRRPRRKIMEYIVFRKKFYSFYSFHWVSFLRFDWWMDDWFSIKSKYRRKELKLGEARGD